ncbi:hypothetical protein ACFSTD_02160 [Novosphingobium colocasiae]|uniref:Uncharacterized protein n=1 Tax=Novosphingobium colocasiae TaxID=1256513 RepID=A0A918PPK8_9SPHN|nr:hypothetical protein GCM10011614_35250 [Novosphingobium colocasiae]
MATAASSLIPTPSIGRLVVDRKSAIFNGSDEGDDNWTVNATPKETCKTSGINRKRSRRPTLRA